MIAAVHFYDADAMGFIYVLICNHWYYSYTAKLPAAGRPEGE